MKTGKISNELLKKIVFDRIRTKRNEVVLGPGIGEDCCAVDLGGDLCVLSSDPITGAVNEIGSLAVHVSCNDIASCGAEPVGIIITILAPETARENDIETIMEDAASAADKLNIDILGGHSEVTDAVNRFVISGTCIGRVPPGGLVTSRGAKPGDDVVLTGSAGIEGTSIIAHDMEEELVSKIGKEIVDSAKSFKDRISVVPEGLIAGKAGASSMHDVTEGGILGAVWELCEASGTGALIDKCKIPLARETDIICRYYGIDPLKLISSGSMLITSKNGDSLVETFRKEGIMASVIGKITADKGRYLVDGKDKKPISSPGPDELYKLF
jgi:hydrogenase expression/formation protein HypE